jgi:hypothetical protein
MNTQIYVTTDFVGYHNWPTAPDSVAFLRSLHRHRFEVKVVFNVGHDDRDLEFFLVKQAVNEIIGNSLLPELHRQRSLSCEQMAVLLLSLVKVRYLTVVSVEISEDGENGAVVTA